LGSRSLSTVTESAPGPRRIAAVAEQWPPGAASTWSACPPASEPRRPQALRANRGSGADAVSGGRLARAGPSVWRTDRARSHRAGPMRVERRTCMARFTRFIVVPLALAAAPGPAFAQHSNVVVGAGDSIQAAVDAAASGQTVGSARHQSGERRHRQGRHPPAGLRRPAGAAGSTRAQFLLGSRSARHDRYLRRRRAQLRHGGGTGPG
jgi:hypothetical protein